MTDVLDPNEGTQNSTDGPQKDGSASPPQDVTPTEAPRHEDVDFDPESADKKETDADFDVDETNAKEGSA